MIIDCNSDATGSALIMVGESDRYSPICPFVGDLAQGSAARCPVTIEIHCETTRDVYHFRGHGRERQDHPDAPVGGTLAFPGADRAGNGGARWSADRAENPADSAGFGQPGTESDHGNPALFRLARAERG